MPLARGDVVILHAPGQGRRSAAKAALIWSVGEGSLVYITIRGIRGFEEHARHRAEVPVPPMEALGAGLPIINPVAFCQNLHARPKGEMDLAPSGRLSEITMAAVTKAVHREIETRAMEDRMSRRWDDQRSAA